MTPTGPNSGDANEPGRLGVDLLRFGRGEDLLVHHHQHAAVRATRARPRRAPPRADSAGPSQPGFGDGADGADEHHRLRGEQQQIEQVGGLLERVGPVRDDEAVDVRALEPRRGAPRQSPHLLRRDVRSGQPRDVLVLDVGDRRQARARARESRHPDSAGTAAPVAGSSFIEMVPPVKRIAIMASTVRENGFVHKMRMSRPRSEWT